MVLARLALQPFDHHVSLYEVLSEALENSSFTDLLIVVAWAKESGFRRIREPVARFRQRGGNTKIIVGVDEGGATVEGLNAAIEEFDEASVVYDSSSGTFHPKIYCVSGDTSGVVIVGSSNLTAGGLFRNYEASVVLDLDLSLDPDKELLESVRQYARELTTDGTSAKLDQALRDTLAATPAFRIAEERAARITAAPEEEESFGVRGPEATAQQVIFGKSSHRKKPDPVRRSARQGGNTTPPVVPPLDHAELVGASEEGGSTAELSLRWTKRLTRSDCGSPRAGSNTTGALRFTKAGHAIDQATWFREKLFIDADWVEDHSRPGRERTNIRFEVRIDGVERGTHPLELKYDATREAGQANFTTDLKWGPLSQIVRSEDLTGQWIAVERLDDGTMRIEVTPEQQPAVIVD